VEKGAEFLAFCLPKKEKQVSEIALISVCLKVRLQFALLKLPIYSNEFRYLYYAPGDQRLVLAPRLIIDADR